MLDLQASLEWINANIEQFGGDPENVTIFGQSGGGSKVTALMRMPGAAGLFHKAGTQSGGAATIQDNSSSARVGELTAELLGLNAETIDEIQTMDYRTVRAAAMEALEIAKTEEGFTRYSFGPVSDGVTLVPDMINAKGIPVINSWCFSESANASYRSGDQRHNEWSDEETMEWLTSRFGDKTEALLAEFLKLYPHKEAHDLYFYNNRRASALNLNKALMEAGATVYNYSFDYEAPTNGGTTAFHCVDLIYAFHNADLGLCAIATGAGEDAMRIQDQVAGAFVNLAYNGTPSTEELPWAPYTVEGNELMLFDVESKCVNFDDAAFNEIYTPEQYNHEAFAEFFWRYLCDKDWAGEYAGEDFVDTFEYALRQKKMLKPVRQAQAQVSAYIHSDVDGKIRSRIIIKSVLFAQEVIQHMFAYHVVTDRPMRVGQQIRFDAMHHSGVYQRVHEKLDLVRDIYANPSCYDADTLEHHTSVALRELALEEVRREKYPAYPSRMSCLYVSRTLAEAESWAAFFVRIGRPTYHIVRLEVDGRCFAGDAAKCFRARLNKQENLTLAQRYWANDSNDSDEPSVCEMLVGGKITVVEIVKEINANIPSNQTVR